MKIISLESMMKEPDANDRIGRIKREIEILNKIKHPSLVTIYKVYSVPRKFLYIVMELCRGGELCELLVREGGHLSELLTRHLMIQIVRAVKYLHDLGIAHRDLKLENILFAHKLPQMLEEVKLASAILGVDLSSKSGSCEQLPCFSSECTSGRESLSSSSSCCISSSSRHAGSSSSSSACLRSSSSSSLSITHAGGSGSPCYGRSSSLDLSRSEESPGPDEEANAKYLELFDIKIIDFGFARQISVPLTPGIEKMSPLERREAWTSPSAMRGPLALSFLGTKHFAAPEMIRHISYDLRCDLYSIGVLLYFLLVGSFPFVTEQLNGQISLDLNEALKFPNPLWNEISPAAKDLVTHLLVDEQERYTADEFLAHPWIVNPPEIRTLRLSSNRRRKLRAAYHHRTSSVKAYTNQVIDFKRGGEGEGEGNEVIQIDGKLANKKKRPPSLNSGPKIVLHSSFSELPTFTNESDSDSDSDSNASASSSPSISPRSSPLCSPPGSPIPRSELLRVPNRIKRSPSPIRLDPGFPGMGLSRSR